MSKEHKGVSWCRITTTESKHASSSLAQLSEQTILAKPYKFLRITETRLEILFLMHLRSAKYVYTSFTNIARGPGDIVLICFRMTTGSECNTTPEFQICFTDPYVLRLYNTKQ